MANQQQRMAGVPCSVRYTRGKKAAAMRRQKNQSRQAVRWRRKVGGGAACARQTATSNRRGGGERQNQTYAGSGKNQTAKGARSARERRSRRNAAAHAREPKEPRVCHVRARVQARSALWRKIYSARANERARARVQYRNGGAWL